MHELSPPYDRMDFQFVPPELNWSRTGNWVNVPIVGRNNSRHHLTGGEDKLSFQLNFSGLFEDNKEHCQQKLSWLLSLIMTDGYVGPVRNVKIVWGTTPLFRHKIWIVKNVTGIMTDFSSNFQMNPMNTTVNVELELDPVENPRLMEVRIENYSTPVRNINDFVTPGNIA